MRRRSLVFGFQSGQPRRARIGNGPGLPVFDYKVGAGGKVASEIVAKARPDGNILLLGTSATHGVNAALYKKLPFDGEADFTPIVPLNDVSNVLTVNPAC